MAIKKASAVRKIAAYQAGEITDIDEDELMAITHQAIIDLDRRLITLVELTEKALRQMDDLRGRVRLND